MRVGDLVRLKKEIGHPDDVHKLAIVLKTKEPTPSLPKQSCLIVFSQPTIIYWADSNYLEIVDQGKHDD